MSNHLAGQSSPYLLEHANNPVDWYPWCDEAFERARTQDKPIFLSIGYSTCHWCHVMARESFEDMEVAQLLNDRFISIKVDREERPDIDNIYMAACQAFSGGGGWPASIFMTWDKKPFFAGTYFPKESSMGMMGFKELLDVVQQSYCNNREALLRSAEDVIRRISAGTNASATPDERLISGALKLYKNAFDEKYGGFNGAPKFPSPHNLIFLMTMYEKTGDASALAMAEKTLVQMYRGGLFDHIGYGFSRYSTDRYYLIPHFEKMLYDNALLIQAYSKAYFLTKKPLYRDIAQKTAVYVLREMTSDEGGFYSAQDADSEGVEGKYYTFEPRELEKLLGREVGTQFNGYYGITQSGNFEGGSVPNLLKNEHADGSLDEYIPIIYEYRRNRTKLHLDDKILTSWNSMMISAMAQLYRATLNTDYLSAAKNACRFIETKLCDGDTLFVSMRLGRRGEKGFIDDYAFFIYALISLCEATYDREYLNRARELTKKTLEDFFDFEHGGFFFYGSDSEQLIARNKETFDGAVPSGNSVMAYNLLRLSMYFERDEQLLSALKKQLGFMTAAAEQYPMGNGMFLTALAEYLYPPDKVTVVLDATDRRENMTRKLKPNAIVTVLDEQTEEYKLLNDETTFYVCSPQGCMPGANDI